MIFIVGGKGFVGSAFNRFCETRGIEHTIITRQNYDEFEGKSCETLINANGNSSKLLGDKDPLADFEATVTSVRKTLVDFNFKKYVLISSCDVYSDCSSPNLTREDSSIDVSKQSTYGFHKYLAEECIRHSASDWLIVRLGGVVGQGLKKNAIFDIINGGLLWLDPQSELQYLNTDEVARIVFELLERGISNDVINVCGDGVVKLQDLLDSQRTVTIKPSSPTVKYDVNIEKLKRITNVPLSMETVINFIQKNRTEF